MANFELKFLDIVNPGSNIQVLNEGNMIVIQGVDKNGFDLENDVDDVEVLFSIYFDKSTAIKFAKTLRTEINKITESEVTDGK